MSKKSGRSSITFIGGSISGNNGNGFLIADDGYDLRAIGTRVDQNGGHGLEIRSPDKAALLDAIAALKRELALLENVDSQRILIEQIQREAALPHINKARLSSIMDTVKSVSVSAIEIVPKIGAAIESVMNAINSLPG